MRTILFCQNAHAFEILAPIRNILRARQYPYLWYVSEKLLNDFPYRQEDYTVRLLDLQLFNSDAIFVPGNEVPCFIRGVKIGMVHGQEAEGKLCSRVRPYFDLYFTPGPYFTKKFEKARQRHTNFEVIETGCSQMDVYSAEKNKYDFEKKAILEQFRTDKIVLYAPTATPELSSAPHLLEEIKDLAIKTGFVVLVKLQDTMEVKWIRKYQQLAAEIPNIIYKEDKNNAKLLLQADILISDTAPSIYPFLLLDKPVITFRNFSPNVLWDNANFYANLHRKVMENLQSDPFAAERTYIKMQYHPYEDGQSAERMVAGAQEYIAAQGVPKTRKLSFLNQWENRATFGKPIEKPFTGPPTHKISAVLITYNEDKHINAVLENLKFADEIIVVDSHSTDGTIEKIKQHPHVKLILRPFVNYTDQKSFALDQASHDWVLFLDADERIPDDLQNEILWTVNSDRPVADAYYFYRTFMFQEEVLRFSGWQRDKNYRLFRKSKVHFTEDRIVHETLVVNGRSDVLKHRLIHYSYNNYEEYKGKMVKYGQMKAVEELEKDYDPNLYHFIVRPAYKFFNHYILRLGILDGKKGVIICYLNALGVFSRYRELKRLRSLK